MKEYDYSCDELFNTIAHKVEIVFMKSLREYDLFSSKHITVEIETKTI